MATAPRTVSKQATIVVVTSVYNATVTAELERGAKAAFESSDVAKRLDLRLACYEVPGAFEVVSVAAFAASLEHVAGVVALGCIIKGETNHDEVLGHAVTSSLASICVQTCKPVGLGVLTVNTQKQALARAGLDASGKKRATSGRDAPHEFAGNKGAEAMNATLATLSTLMHVAQGTVQQPATVTHDKLRARSASSGKAKKGKR
jgi:6,7-dimethyl-8-ribityllumazine synthase